MIEDLVIPENKRTCSVDGEPVGRSRDGVPGRTEGFCPKCGIRSRSSRSSQPHDVVGGQYEIGGCLAHGGLGWIYLARDRTRRAPLGRAEGPAQHRRPRRARRPRSPSAGSSSRSITPTSSRSTTSSSTAPTATSSWSTSKARASVASSTTAAPRTTARRPAAGRPRDRLLPGDPPRPRPTSTTSGLLFCDFKPDNVIHTGTSLKLIDLGGVYRMGDEPSPALRNSRVPGPRVLRDRLTPSAPVRPVHGRTHAGGAVHGLPVATRARTEFTLPPRATSTCTPGTTRCTASCCGPPPSTPTSGSRPPTTWPTSSSASSAKSWRSRPGPPRRAPARSSPRIRAATTTVPTGARCRRCSSRPTTAAPDTCVGRHHRRDAIALVTALERSPDQTLEVKLARALIAEDRRAEAAATVLDAVGEADPGDWRVAWYRGVGALAAGAPETATKSSNGSCTTLARRAGPQAGPGVAAEPSGERRAPRRSCYEIVSRTDPGFTQRRSASPGCHAALGDRAGSVAAYDRVPDLAAPTSRRSPRRRGCSSRQAASSVRRRGRRRDRRAAPAGDERSANPCSRPRSSKPRYDSADPGRGHRRTAVVARVPLTDRGVRRASKATYRVSGPDRRHRRRTNRTGRPGQPAAPEDPRMTLTSRSACPTCGDDAGRTSTGPAGRRSRRRGARRPSPRSTPASPRD